MENEINEGPLYMSSATFVRFGRLILNVESIESITTTQNIKNCTIMTKSGDVHTAYDDGEKMWAWWCDRVADVLAAE
jgi:hypothetical protein